MKRFRIFSAISVVLAVVAIGGCNKPLDFFFGEEATPQSTQTAGGGQATPAASQGELAHDYASVVAKLQAVGGTVEPGDEIEQPFFSVSGRIIKVNGQDVQVFEYPDAASADAEAAAVSPDGSSVGTTMMTWMAAPHFYKSGRVIVLYVGSDVSVIKALLVVLGPQFAGR
jgi:hypothetical protein